MTVLLAVIFLATAANTAPYVQAAEPTISIVMEQATYRYCEKLFYTINVSEITGDSAIIHIVDQTGKGSSAIPMAITQLENPVPSLIPFEAEIFPLGKYTVDVQYSGSATSAEFELVESDSICIPALINPIVINWLSGNISDGFLLDAFQKYIDDSLIKVPFEINENNVYNVNIPEWVKSLGQWWIQGVISDSEFSNAINYLLEKEAAGIFMQDESEA